MAWQLVPGIPIMATGVGQANDICSEINGASGTCWATMRLRRSGRANAPRKRGFWTFHELPRGGRLRAIASSSDAVSLTRWSPRIRARTSLPDMSLHWLKSLCGMLLLAILSSGAAAQDCPARFAFSTADDRQGCIADYGYFEASPYGWPSVLRRLIPVSGAYVVAAAPNLPSCRPGFGFVGPRQTGMPLQSVPDDAERIDRAMRDCGQQAGHPEGLCACRLLLVDARSTFSLSEFEAYVGHRGSFALPPPPPPVTPMAPADAAAMVAVENAVAAGVAQFVERYQPGLSAKPEASHKPRVGR